MSDTPYKRLAERLDALPNGFPAAPDGAELRLLAKLFTPEEAALASQLRLTLETPAQLAERLGGEAKILRNQLKEMARRGLISAGRCEGGLGYGLMPFVVGIYEMQIGRIDAELARLFEDYYRQAFGVSAAVHPQVHRVIPIHQAVKTGLEIRPHESAAGIVDAMQSWGVLDCICRVQKALIGQACHHPVEVCMVLSNKPGAFDSASGVRALSKEQAMDVLHQAAEAGLVHSVSNNQHGNWYICNCCTCSCGLLRGVAELGMADVVAKSPFVLAVDENRCQACGACITACQFGALHMEATALRDERRCVGCGVCVPACPEEALSLVRRAHAETPPETEADWRIQRAAARGIDLAEIL
ncbi:MAG: ATP-binding protein [Chloroflexota bacterium]